MCNMLFYSISGFMILFYVVKALGSILRRSYASEWMIYVTMYPYQ